LGNHAKLIEHRKHPVKHKNIQTSILKKISQIEKIQGLVFSGSLFSQAWRTITWSCLNAYDVQQQYPDHTFQVLETAAMLREFCELYLRNPAAMLKRMLHVAGILPNARTAADTQPSTPEQNRLAEAICTRYDLTY